MSAALVQAPLGNYISFATLHGRLWIDSLGLDESPYYFFNDTDAEGRSIKSDVETAWMKEPAEKRRVVEKIAIQLWQKCAFDLHTLPLREQSSLIPQLSTPPFHQIDIQATVGDGDAILKRRTWLYGIGFPEACNYAPPQTSEQIAALDQLFAYRPVLERKAIVSKAKALNLMANPPSLSWSTIQEYEIYPVGCFTSHQEYVRKRREWLETLGLNHWPFSYVSFANRYNESAEVAWSEMTLGQRSTILDQAWDLRNRDNPLLVAWDLVEEIFGYSLQAHFDGDQAAYDAKRVTWLESVGISQAPDEAEFLGLWWYTKPVEEKWVVLKKATSEKEKFCAEYLSKTRPASTPVIEWE